MYGLKRFPSELSSQAFTKVYTNCNSFFIIVLFHCMVVVCSEAYNNDTDAITMLYVL